MNLKEDGAQHYAQALSGNELKTLEALAKRYNDVGPGARLKDDDQLAKLLSPSGALQKIAKIQLGEGANPVRAILFDKNSQNNWSLGWHQD